MADISDAAARTSSNMADISDAAARTSSNMADIPDAAARTSIWLISQMLLQELL